MPPQCGAAAWLHVGSSPRESSPCWHKDSFPKELFFPEVRQALKPLTENSFHCGSMSNVNTRKKTNEKLRLFTNFPPMHYGNYAGTFHP